MGALMSNHKNHRRKGDKNTGTGPRYENSNPSAGCNSTHVARSRRKWHDRRRRANRRNGGQGGFLWGRPFAATVPQADEA